MEKEIKELKRLKGLTVSKHYELSIKQTHIQDLLNDCESDIRHYDSEIEKLEREYKKCYYECENEKLQEENEKLIDAYKHVYSDGYKQGRAYSETIIDELIEKNEKITVENEKLLQENKYLKERCDKWKQNAIELCKASEDADKELETYYEKEKNND